MRHRLCRGDLDRILFNEVLKLLAGACQRGAQPVIADGRRDRGGQADGSGGERFGDARRHDREAGVLGFGDGEEGGHDAPDGSKQADEGGDGGDHRQIRQAAFEAGEKRLGRTTHAVGDARAGFADALARDDLRRRPPACVDDRNQKLGRRMQHVVARGANRLIEPPNTPDALDDEHPAPDRGGEQRQQDGLGDRPRLEEQPDRRQRRRKMFHDRTVT